MGIAISTAGVTVGYAVETEKGKRPTTGFIFIPDIKEVPEMNPEPENLESTVLSETEYKTYIAGLKDLGGALSFLANYTAELETVWGKLVTDSETGAGTGLATWFEIKHPKLDKSVFFTGQPSAMGLPAMSVNSILETNLYITPTNAPAWEAKSTANA
jgi:hypothetical protein